MKGTFIVAALDIVKSSKQLFVQIGELLGRGPIRGFQGPGRRFDPEIHQRIDDECALVVSPRLIELRSELRSDAILGDVVPQLAAAAERETAQRQPSFGKLRLDCQDRKSVV